MKDDTNVILGTQDNDYIHAQFPKKTKDALLIFADVGLRPVPYGLHIGHKFYDAHKKGYFILSTQKTVDGVNFYRTLGEKDRFLWMPSIEEILEQAHVDGIAVSIQASILGVSVSYRTFVADSMQNSLPFPRRSVFRHTTVHPWFAVALPVAEAYAARAAAGYALTQSPPLYVETVHERKEPFALIDQTMPVL